MTETDIKEELDLYFSSPGAGGASLHKAIADKIIAHLISEEEQDMEFVESLSADDLVEILEHATGKKPMNYVIDRIRAFADKDYTSSADRSPLATNAGDKKGHQVGVGEEKKTESVPKKKDQHTNDMTAQGMSERQLMAFIASYINGVIIDESEIMDEKVGSDPLTWECTKAWRKAKTGTTLMEIFASNDQPLYQEMLTNLIRDYNQRGCTTEVTTLTAFKTETEEVYSSHPKGILPYVKRFHAKYKARGFPVCVDLAW